MSQLPLDQQESGPDGGALFPDGKRVGQEGDHPQYDSFHGCEMQSFMRK